VRAFIGIPLPLEVREKISEFVAGMAPLISGVKWVEKDNYHITLKFLGEVSEEKVRLLASRLEETSRGVTSFSICLSGFGAFPALSYPRVLWIGVSEGGELVRDLHSRIEDVAKEFGFQPEQKSFHPHVTIGRIRRPRKLGDLLRLEREVVFGDVVVNEFCLYRSTLTREGPIYDIIDFVELVKSE